MKDHLLIIDDDEAILSALEMSFQRDYTVHLAANGPDGIDRFSEVQPIAVILDLNMPEMPGLEVLVQLKSINPEIPVIILTAYADIDNAVQSIKLGAEQFLTKPVDLQVLQSMIGKAASAARLRDRYEYLKEKSAHPRESLIISPHTTHAIKLAARNSDVTVIITGPTGAGKGVVAELIHRESDRAAGPLIDINCAALSEALLESDLFGHERGAFTDAKETKKGLMEIADGGAIFFDEIGEMPLPIQAKLLKAIENKTFRRVGGVKNFIADVRVIAATNEDLTQAVRNGKFREDLYYRLNVLSIPILPLRERKDEIPLLAMLFLEQCRRKSRTKISGLGEDAQQLLVNYHWPGNVRELRNVIERACILCEEEMIKAKHLPPEIRRGDSTPRATGANLLTTLAEVEKRQIRHVLEHTHNNKTAAARILGIDVTTLARKLKRYQKD